LITSSVQASPLDESTLSPVVGPMLDQLRYEQASTWLEDVSSRLSFNQDDLVNESDPASPATDLQRAWFQFWQTASAAQRQALTAQREDGAVAHPREFGQAMLAFERKWKKSQQEKNESAGASSARLAGAQQTKSSGRSSSGGTQLRTEADGFASVFKQAS